MPGLAPRYRRLATLARRPGCLTLSALDRLTGDARVLKLAAAGSSDAGDLVDEAERLRGLAHPAFLPLVDRFKDQLDFDGQERVSGFALPFFEGRHLGRALADQPLDARLAAFGQLVDAVGYLHRCGLLHLDLKPANVLVGADRLVLLDLGTARPLTAGPGAAGGTLGHAAPEVLAGEAATVQSDIFSLGVLLYELLTGHPPHGSGAAADLRRAVLAGELVPVAAWGVPVPAALGALAMAMLARRTVDRPTDLDELRARCVDAGIAVPRADAGPRWVARQGVEEAARRALSSAGLVAFVGDPGSGRRRLAGRQLSSARLRGLDLSTAPDLRVALGRLASAVDPRVPLDPDDATWRQAAGVALGKGAPVPLVYLGEREAVPRSALADVDVLAAALVGGGARVLWVSRAPLSKARVVHVGAVRGDEAAELARWCGVPPGGAVHAALRRSGGLIGRLIGTLSLSPSQTGDLDPASARLLAALSGLPDGVPAALVDALPDTLRVALPRLEAAGLARREDDGVVYVARPQAAFPDDDDLRAAVASALGPLADTLDPLWRSVCGLRLGLDDPAPDPALFDLDAADADAIPLLRELLTAWTGRGHALARRSLVDLHLRKGDNDAAMALVDAVDAPDVHDLAARVTVLRRRFQTDEAWELVNRLALDPTPPYRVWVELGLVATERGELGPLEEAIDRLRRLGSRHEVRRRFLEIKAAQLRIARGEPAEDLDTLLTWALHEAPDQGLVSQIAMLACDAGRPGVGLRLYSKAIAIADAEARVLQAAGLRMQRALRLERLGRVAEARRGLEDALLVAERAHNRAVHVQVLYNLARLELRAGRLPAAEAHMRAFDALTADSDVAEVVVRGALNRAWLHLLRGEPAAALSCFEGLPDQGISRDASVQLLHLSAWASLDLGRPHDVLRLLDEAGDLPGDPAFAPIATALRGRAHLALGRQALDDARSQIPDAIEPGTEPVVGEVMLAWGGEDADPAAFPARREALGLAARFLRGPLAARAARLRERMLDGPGAALGEVVALTEAMHDPQAFPEALARLVKESLGAHRVLIMLRLPGLGNQLGYSELSGEQAAGIGREVLERIQRADDVWISGDAFADPELRQSSQTVQTFELKSLLAVAIPRGDDAVGALYVDDMYRANRFDDEDVALLQRLARAVGGMIPLMRRDPGVAGDEPSEVLGVRLPSAAHAAELQAAIDMVRGVPEGNLLVTGPTGSGKSVLARRLATEVLGLDGVEVVVLRSGDPQMLVTQLFGSRRGEFTGAMDRQGAIERCRRERKALFLDEVQNLDETGQQILLPLLDLPRSFGGLTGTARRLDFPLHVLLGTNHDVSGDRAFEVFRSDLWFRMSRSHVHLPPLAERGAEVVYRYLAEMLGRRELPAPERVFETSALYRVTHAPWPGNLRELDAFAERVAHAWQARPDPIAVHRLRSLRPGASLDEARATGPEPDKGASLGDAMVQHVMGVLRRHLWVQKTAADELGMNPPTLNKFLKRNGLLDEVRRRRRMAN